MTTARRNAAAPKKDPKAKDPKRAWMFVVDLPPDISGTGPRRKQVLRRGFATKAQAQAALDALRVDARKGQHVDRSTITVEQYLEEWIAGLPGTVRPSTAASYEAMLRSHVIPRIGGAPLQELRSTELEAMYAALRAPGANLRDKSGKTALSARSISYIHTITKRALREAVDHGLLAANPAAKVRPPAHQHDPTKIKVWSKAELGAFLDHAEAAKDRDYPLWLLVSSTGMRRGEALGLQEGDVDLESGRLTIRRTLVTVGHAVHISAPKTAAGARTIVLDEGTVAALKSHRVRRASERLLLGAGKATAEDWIFADVEGHPYHPNAVSQRLNRKVKDAGIKHIGIHGLRHTWATLAIEAGVPIKVVQLRLGHTTSAITMDFYIHVSEAMGRDAAQTVADSIPRKTKVVIN